MSSPSESQTIKAAGSASSSGRCRGLSVLPCLARREIVHVSAFSDDVLPAGAGRCGSWRGAPEGKVLKAEIRFDPIGIIFLQFNC